MANSDKKKYTPKPSSNPTAPENAPLGTGMASKAGNALAERKKRMAKMKSRLEREMGIQQ